MPRPPRSVRPLLPLLMLALVLSAPATARAAVCAPAGCPAVFRFVNFEAVAPGASVEGLGAVHPDLRISSLPWTLGPSCAAGSAAGIEEGNSFPFDAYSTLTGGTNGCLSGTRGFADEPNCVLDYDFTFAPGVTVGCFGIRILDFGDYFPYGGATHTVTLTGYDASNAVVNVAQLIVTGGEDLPGGDACISQAGPPGNTVLAVAGFGIVKVTLRYDGFPDPNVGYDDIAFCELTSPTPANKRSWGTLKSHHR